MLQNDKAKVVYPQTANIPVDFPSPHSFLLFFLFLFYNPSQYIFNSVGFTSTIRRRLQLIIFRGPASSCLIKSLEAHQCPKPSILYLTLLVFVFSFIFLNRLSPVLSVPISSPDDLTLAEIQSQWNISSWSGPPDCSRQGIGCDRFNRVISIQIQGSLDDPAGTYANPPLTFPAAVMNLTSLQSYVQIGADASRGPSGTIPSGFWLLPALHTVKFAYSSFSGTFPTTLRSVLTSVDLCDNQFSGVLPLGVITARLNTLVLAGNSFSGVLPSFASALALIYLDLSDNGFFGDFPVTLTNCPSLRQISLYGNQLISTIPVDLPMSLPVLVDSNVGFNLLSGSIPDFAQSNLNTLLLNNN